MPRSTAPAAALALACGLFAGVAAAAPRFAAPFLAYDSGFDARAVAIADVDGNGRPDVLIVNADGLEVRLGVGDGSIGPATVFTPGGKRMLVVGDLDGDGALDVLYDADSLHIGVRRGNGDGTFQPPVSHVVAKGPAGAVLADLDRDGDLDLVCTAERDNVVSVLLGDGSGGFGAKTDVPTGAAPGPIAAGDLDHDGDPDVLVANRLSATLTWLRGNGAGGLTAAGTVTLTANPGSVALADLDGDSWLDAVAGSYSTAEIFIVPALVAGGFAPVLPLAVADVTSGVVVEDFDADAHPDIAVLDYTLNRGEVRRGLGGFSFGGPQPFSAPRNAWGLAVGDMNGGGKSDLVTICPFGPVGVHMGNGDGTFGGVKDPVMGANPWSVACRDLDADGHDDLVTANSSAATLSVRFGDGGGAFSAPVTLTTGVEPHGVTIADADADGHLDLVVAEHGPGIQTASEVSVFRGDGARGFAARDPYTVARWAQQVAVGDLNADGLPDLGVACLDAGTVTVLEGLENGRFGNRHDYPLGMTVVGVAIADVTRDLEPDVVAANYDANAVHVLPGNGNGTFQTPFALAVPHPRGVVVADVAGDGAPDLVLGGEVGVSVFASVSGGGFASRVDYGGGSGPPALGDFDADGRADVATANGWPTNTVSVWFGKPGGGLGTAIAYGGGDRPFGVATGDVNDDGRTDLVSANLEGNSVSLLLNTGGAPWPAWLGRSPAPPPSASFGLVAAPNPVSGPGTIRYTLPRPAHVRLRLLDLAGRHIAWLAEGDRPAGPQSVSWDAGGKRAGISFIELRVDGERAVRRVAIVP